jgi:hypothetical protein
MVGLGNRAKLMSVSSIVAAAGMGLSRSFLIDPGSQNYSSIIPSGNSICGIRIATDRDVDERDSGGYTDRADWLDAVGTPADYEVRVTVDSGSLDAGSDTTGSYIALSSSREWYTDDIQSADLTISIRRATYTADEISFTCQLVSDNSPI